MSQSVIATLKGMKEVVLKSNDRFGIKRECLFDEDTLL